MAISNADLLRQAYVGHHTRDLPPELQREAEIALRKAMGFRTAEPRAITDPPHKEPDNA